LCRAEGSQRFQQRCGETTFYFYAFSLRSVKGKACGSFAASPIFYFLLMKCKTVLQNKKYGFTNCRSRRKYFYTLK
jgi:hypothetical protein